VNWSLTLCNDYCTEASSIIRQSCSRSRQTHHPGPAFFPPFPP